MTQLDEFLDAVRRLDGLQEKGETEEARAWRLVRGTLQLPTRPPLPPNELGEAASEARALADLLTKTGQDNEWRTPAAHSQAMERLIHRLTNLLETFLNVYAAGMPRRKHGRFTVDVDVDKAASKPAPGPLPDDHYQTSYCDDCGAELDTSGSCPVCAKDQPRS